MLWSFASLYSLNGIIKCVSRAILFFIVLSPLTRIKDRKQSDFMQKFRVDGSKLEFPQKSSGGPATKLPDI